MSGLKLKNDENKIRKLGYRFQGKIPSISVLHSRYLTSLFHFLQDSARY